jgi:hypothetical protein
MNSQRCKIAPTTLRSTSLRTRFEACVGATYSLTIEAMKTLSTMLVCALFGCGGGNKKTDPGTSGSAASTGEGQPCTQEIALVCPDGQIDACEKALADGDKPASDDDDASGGTGTAMALDEGRMSKLENAGTHRCVAK